MRSLITGDMHPAAEFTDIFIHIDSILFEDLAVQENGRFKNRTVCVAGSIPLFTEDGSALTADTKFDSAKDALIFNNAASRGKNAGIEAQ